jgi:hypothetical protein
MGKLGSSWGVNLGRDYYRALQAWGGSFRPGSDPSLMPETAHNAKRPPTQRPTDAVEKARLRAARRIVRRRMLIAAREERNLNLLASHVIRLRERAKRRARRT